LFEGKFVKMIKELVDKILWKKLWVLTGLNKQKGFVKNYECLRKSTTLNHCDMFNVYSCALACNKLEGDVAEVGVYKGSSVKLIKQMTNKVVFAFDTFNGIPEITKFDKKQGGGMFKKGDFNSGLEIITNLQKLGIKTFKGIFPQETGKFVEKESFCFVHLDVDVYKSTKDCLQFFYPRLVSGGIILSHDYPNSLGVKKAFDEFFKDKKEVLICLLDQQVLVVKK